MVEPGDPFEGGEFHGIEAAPGTFAMDQFSLVEAIGGFGEGVVARVADTSDRWLVILVRVGALLGKGVGG